MRYRYEMKPDVLQTHKIGQVQTIMRYNVAPGDRVTQRIYGNLNMHALKRDNMLDAQIDVVVAFVPHRHIYGDNDWQTFIKNGSGASVSWPTSTNTGGLNARDCQYLMLPRGHSNTIPRWITGGYNHCWNWLFRFPNDTAKERAFSYVLPNTVDLKRYGEYATHLADETTAGVDSNVVPVASDQEVASVSNVSLVDLDEQAARFQRALREAFEYDGERYSERIRDIWRTTPSHDADPRPTLIHHHKQNLGGYDVHGTGDQNLGSFSAVQRTVIDSWSPLFDVMEHGTIWTFLIARFPPIYEYRAPYLDLKPQFTYDEMAADPLIMANTQYHERQTQDYFTDGNTQSLGMAPYGNWHRFIPNHICDELAQLNGYPHIRDTPTSLEDARYISPNDYDDMFVSPDERGHFHTQLSNKVFKSSLVPPARASVYVGAS